MDDCLYNMGGISSKTPIVLPPKLKIYDAEKFDRTGDSKPHVRRYLRIAEVKGFNVKQTLHAFPLSLRGGASRWYYSLDPSKTKDEKYSTDLLPYCIHEVIAMMKNIGYNPSMGLRKEGRGVIEFPDFKTQLTKEGLGFYKGRDGIKKNLGTLNENFVKE
ncbi:hypothetical protein SO802_012422 [Lithocarpus litseifolius]|uniref:G-patch domain-containing protein n=1 Tax=Lithocarpus litseifolius TaxID=425828 RepID=A0AAW2D6M7_9ROSI